MEGAGRAPVRGECVPYTAALMGFGVQVLVPIACAGSCSWHQLCKSTCLGCLQIHVSVAAPKQTLPGVLGSQKALAVLCLCLQSLALPEQAFVAGLNEGEVQGGAQPGFCVQAVPSEAPRAAQADLSFK